MKEGKVYRLRLSIPRTEVIARIDRIGEKTVDCRASNGEQLVFERDNIFMAEDITGRWEDYD